jgi:hypothetical protein
LPDARTESGSGRRSLAVSGRYVSLVECDEIALLRAQGAGICGVAPSWQEPVDNLVPGPGVSEPGYCEHPHEGAVGAALN